MGFAHLSFLGPSHEPGSTGIVRGRRERGAAITVFNCGRTDDRLGPDVRRPLGDRQDFPAFAGPMATTGPWDVVIDMICFRPDEPESARRAFTGDPKGSVAFDIGHRFSTAMAETEM